MKLNPAAAMAAAILALICVKSAAAATLANGSYSLTPENATALRLNVKGNGTANGTLLTASTSNGTTAQTFVVSNTGVTPTGDYNISKSGGSYCIQPTGTTSGSTVEIYACAGTAAQAWSITADSSPAGYYQLSPSNATGLRLDNTGTSSGSAIEVVTSNSSSAQQWTTSTTTTCSVNPGAPTGLSASGTTSSGTTLSWSALTAPSGCSISSYTVYQSGTAIGTTTSTSYALTGLAASTTYSFTVAATDAHGAGSQSSPVSVTTSAGSSGGMTTGTVSFHLLLGLGSSADSMTLTGGNYNDLIMSNMIAGVMYGHLVKEYYPGIQFNNDYLYGSVMAQLLQENIATQDYISNGTLIDPSSSQQAVMAQGQGGPYQINNYAIDMVGGSYTPSGHSLINFIAVQKNIGYTMANAATQYTQVTPPSFNNKYYGPMLPAFFHYIDFVALNIIGKGVGGWTTPWEPMYDEALANFVNLPNSFLDMLLNVAYNQGYYGGLVTTYSTEGDTATAATVASVDSYSSVWGNSSTYVQYPYQVHYYLDQMYDKPIPTTSPTTTVTPTNHIYFTMSTLEGVFSNVFQTLDYSNGTAAAQYFTASQATTAFNSALSSNGVSSSTTLDLSNSSNRAQIFAVINSAIGNLETTSGMKFNSTTLSQL